MPNIYSWTIQPPAVIGTYDIDVITKVRSGNINVWDMENFEKILEDVERLRLNMVNVPVKIVVPDASSYEMTVDGMTKALAIELIAILHERGINVILEPYPWIANGTIGETEWNPSDINEWFWNWKTVVLNELINDIAAPMNVWGIYAASNLVNMEYATGYWQDTFAYIKSMYSGKVLYRTNWWITATWAPETIEAYQNKLNNQLFGDENLDIIAIAAYFELTETPVPSAEEVKNCLFGTTKYNRGQNVFQEIKNFHDLWGKPIFFGELGFVPYAYTASEPWNPQPSSNYSEAAQKNCYQAYVDVFGGQSWLLGMSVFCIGTQTNYSITGRLAESVWYKWGLANEIWSPGQVDDITTVLTSPIRQYLTKIEWLDWNENTVGDYTLDVLDGNISVDASRDVRRTFSMTVNNTTGLYIPNGARTNLGVKVRLKRGIKTATGEVWWNKGIFVLTDPEMIDRGAEQTVNLQGVDKWALLNGDLGGTLTDTTVIPNGTNVAEAIMAVARDGGETKFAFDICTVMTPYTITKEPGTTRADLMKELALIPSWELFYDIDGYLRFRPIIDPLQKQIVVDLSSTSIYHKNLVETTYHPEWSKIRNYWKVIGYSDSTTGITYDGTAQDNNPESPTNTATPPAGIGVKAEVLTDDNLTTDDLCEQRAAYELRQNLRRIDRYTHSIIPLPFLQEGDCIQLDEGKMEIQAFSEPLGLGLMQLECWKAVSIFERVSSSTFDTGLDGWQQLQSGVIDVYGISGNNCMRKQTYDDPNGGYKLLDKKVIDFELILYTRRDSGTGLNAYSITDSSGNGYGITLDYSGNLTIDKRTAWARSVLKSTTVSPVLTNWYTLRLQKIGSNITAEVYDGKVIKFVTPLASTAVNDSSYTSFDRAAVNGGYVFFTDDVIVRKLL